jgi:homocysteine S-methyltransferase
MFVLSELSRDSEPVIIDGGLATQLESYGCDLRDSLWSATVLLSAPELIVRAHREFLDAGAQVIATATYQATFEGLSRRGFDAHAAQGIFERAVGLARQAREEASRTTAAIAGSIGSYGAFLADGSEYSGDYGLSVAELVAFHRPRLAVMAPLVDVIACETIPCLAEARALAICLAELETPAWVSFSCRDARRVAGGEPLAQCVEVLANVAGVVALGVNCVSPRLVPALARIVRNACDQAVIVYPNSGERYDGAWRGEPTSVADFAALARGWRDAGATIIGGCCRTSPAHIAAVARALRSA